MTAFISSLSLLFTLTAGVAASTPTAAEVMAQLAADGRLNAASLEEASAPYLDEWAAAPGNSEACIGKWCASCLVGNVGIACTVAGPSGFCTGYVDLKNGKSGGACGSWNVLPKDPQPTPAWIAASLAAVGRFDAESLRDAFAPHLAAWTEDPGSTEGCLLGICAGCVTDAEGAACALSTPWGGCNGFLTTSGSYGGSCHAY